MQKLTPTDYTQMPWKNGGGITREVALCEVDGVFHWRLSIADVGQDGPFSAFPGRDRILTVIEGDGIRLTDTKDATQIDALPLQPVRFRGDQEIASILLNGPIRDFNLMYNPESVAGEVTVLKVQKDGVETTNADALYCVTGQGVVNDLIVQAGDTVLADEDTPLSIASDNCVCLLITMAPIVR